MRDRVLDDTMQQRAPLAFKRRSIGTVCGYKCVLSTM